MLAKLEGLVTEVHKYKNGCEFTVYTVNSKKTYQCQIDDFCPLDEGDTISALVSVDSQPLRLVQRPIVTLPRTEEVIAAKIKQALTWKRVKVSSNQAFDIYQYLSGGQGPDAADELILKARFYGQALDLNLKPWQKSKLITWWYKQRILRPLWLLGLTNKEIEPHREKLLGLRQRIITNPYQVVTIPMDKCKQIVDQYQLDLPGHDRLGEITRFIYAKMNRGWTSVPLGMIYKEFPTSPALMEHLERDYGLVRYMNTAYLDYAHRAETFLVDLVNRDRQVRSVELVTSNYLTEDQLKAVKLALSHDLSIITGGPGTGKTTLIKELVKQAGVELASFTGKAVVRLKEVTRKPAKTLHLLLNEPKRQIEHLVIDEASMVSLDLFYQVVSRFTPKRITLIGDKDQLEPIDWGNMFDPLIQSQRVPTVELTQNHRSSSGIVANLDLIRSCINFDPELEDGIPQLQEYNDFVIEEGGLAKVEMLLQLIKEKGFGTDQFKVITPYNKDIDLVNQTCQQLFNPNPGITINGREFRVGDPVMMIDNRYEIGIMNGQEGTVVRIDHDQLLVRFDSSTIPVPFKAYDDELSIDHLIVSYAITVHRAQGSEWDLILFYVPAGASDNFINRRLVYTALSRAKKQVYYVGDKSCRSRGLLQGTGYRCNNLYSRLTN